MSKLNRYDLEKIKRNKASEKRIQDAMKVIFDEINVMGNEELVQDVMFNSITSEHRTLQQNYFRATMGIISQYGKQESYMYDARNEQSVIACREIEKTLRDKNLYFPFI